ncbi:MAG: DNA-directed RNA polymerase subunit P [Candidatus Pacearchaeota archaeon]|nr:DNA-directed RNA polymerase subunit P [Candidatus Pacearchaeota archaeon]
MPVYKCFSCGKEISDKALKTRFSCPYCGCKIFFKPRKTVKRVKAV